MNNNHIMKCFLFTILIVSLLGCATSKEAKVMTMKERCAVLDKMCDSIGVGAFRYRAQFPYHIQQYQKSKEGINMLRQDVDSYFKKYPHKITPRTSEDNKYKSTYDFVTRTNGNGVHLITIPYKLSENLLLNLTTTIDCQNGLDISYSKASLALLKSGKLIPVEENFTINDLNVQRIKEEPTVFSYSFSVKYGNDTYFVDATQTPKYKMLKTNGNGIEYKVRKIK